MRTEAAACAARPPLLKIAGLLARAACTARSRFGYRSNSLLNGIAHSDLGTFLVYRGNYVTLATPAVSQADQDRQRVAGHPAPTVTAGVAPATHL
jgi:hypothetical protein